MATMRVLELRIHGIANSPPTDMLCTTQEFVERNQGDDEGSFWRIKAKDSGAATSKSGGAEIVTEAYSWGSQARSGGKALAVVGRAFVHVGWLLVLPFGLCNLAYWARRDIKGADEDATWWAGGAGAIPVRIFALLQTLFYTVGLLTVFVHLIGLQCFQTDASRGRVACAALPAGLDAVSSWNPTARAALFSIVPILVILLIYAIGLRTRNTFQLDRSFDPVPKRAARRREPVEEARPDTDPPRPALLSSDGFWRRVRVANTTARAHFAGAIALTMILLAADAVSDAYPSSDLIGVVTSIVLDGVDSGVAVALGVLLIGILLLGAVFALTAAARLTDAVWSLASKGTWSAALLAIAIAGYALWVVWSLVNRELSLQSLDSELRGLIVAPTLIAAGAALIAVASLAWGYRWRHIGMWVLLPLALASGIVSLVLPRDGADGGLRVVLSWSALGFVLLAISLGVIGFRDPQVRAARRVSGWRGNGATVTLLLALLSSLMITSVLVLGAYSWLTADTDAPDVKDGWRVIEQQGVAGETAGGTGAAVIAPPEFHQRFAGLLLILLIVAILITGAGVLSALRKSPALSLPGPRIPVFADGAVVDPDERLGGVSRLTAHRSEARPEHSAKPDPTKPQVVRAKDYPSAESSTNARLRAVADARQVAGLLHRGEPLLLLLAILTAVALVPLAIPYFGESLQESAANFWGPLNVVSAWVLGLLGVAAVAWVVTNAVTSTERPLGLVWDVICYFPRAGHPFAPPCYGERAVSEVSKRVREWMDAEGDNGRVILSAHSMGATIAVGSIMELAGEKTASGSPLVDRVALLTHGVQLRPYFSRFFPEVFGPRVLGIRGTRGPSLFGADAWKHQVIDDTKHPDAALQKPNDPKSVVQILGGDFSDPKHPVAPRWRSLWRRTDYLGFPVMGFWSNETATGNENPIDRGATERSPRSYLWAVARHSDYLSTRQYREARDELIAMLKTSVPGGSWRREIALRLRVIRRR
ncbi:alpha-beta hydrolase superfamily lysophospholipase [Mycetocola sp. CAN_C7]|uniref:hypothetical protein n=1 Tax=Mycetocola sp. CAN_C7 TaxID=2787724 RepID=UPI0018C941A5